jgi:molybdenum cofactor cytidylyltransferase
MAPLAKPSLQALVLAAGAGSRFGGGKLLAPWRGGLLIEAALAAAFAAPVEGVTVVTGADPEVAEAVRGLAERAGQPVSLVAAEDWGAGLSASLKAGIAALPRRTTGALVFLGDMPRVPHVALAPLAEALASGASAAVPVWKGKIGHPAAISSGLFPAILRLDGDRGARGLLESLGPALVRIEAPDDGVLFDVDRPEDLDQS